MANEITHFEIYGDVPSKTAEFYSQIFGWLVERMEGLDYWRVFLMSMETDRCMAVSRTVPLKDSTAGCSTST